MKIKILISSSSGLDYIPHPNTISIMHDIIKYSDEEEYVDYVELKSEAFYNRLKYDTRNIPVVLPATMEDIRKDIDEALKEFDFVIIIIPATGIVDYLDNANDAIIGLENKVRIIPSNLVGYPLANMALEIDKAIKAKEDLDEVITSFSKSDKESATYFYSPLKDFVIAYDENVSDVQFFKHDTKGLLYELKCSTLIQLKLHDDNHQIEEMFSRYLKAAMDSSGVPFILYSSEFSQYNEYLSSKFTTIYKKIRKVKSYPLPPSIGAIIGANVIGIGFVRKISNREK